MKRRNQGSDRAPGSYLRNPRQTNRRNGIRQGRAGAQEMLTTKRHLLKMIITNLLPLEISENSNFLSFAKALNPTQQIPNKSVIHLLLLKVYQEKEKALRETLAKADDIVLTCELWSSRPGDSYLTTGCHFVDKHGMLKSYLLKTTSLFGDESADNIIKQLSATMEAWCLTEKVHTVVRAGMPQLKKTKTRWSHMPCFADTLNVIFKDLMNNVELSNVLRKCENIVRFFKCDSEAENRLREIQRRLDMKREELIMYLGDRWLVLLSMLQRLDEQYAAMVTVFDERGKADLNLNKHEREKIKNIISALRPLKTATSTMKNEGFQTISVMLRVLKTLMGELNEEKKRKNDVAKTLLSKCVKEFGDVDKHILAPITFLDPRYKNDVEGENKTLAADKIMQELTADGASSAHKFKDVLDRYTAYKPNAEDSNPLAWWRFTGKEKFGELSKLALRKLGVVSTAVPLERAFSSAGDQFCNLRSSIDPENLNMILFLNTNWATDL